MILELPRQAGGDVSNALCVECMKRFLAVRKGSRIAIVADNAIIFFLKPAFPQGVAEFVDGSEVERVDNLRWRGRGVNSVEREAHEGFDEDRGLRHLFRATVTVS